MTYVIMTNFWLEIGGVHFSDHSRLTTFSLHLEEKQPSFTLCFRGFQAVRQMWKCIGIGTVSLMALMGLKLVWWVNCTSEYLSWNKMINLTTHCLFGSFFWMLLPSVSPPFMYMCQTRLNGQNSPSYVRTILSAQIWEGEYSDRSGS